MAAPFEITDPVYRPPAAPGPLDRLALRFINDPRDLPFIHLSLLIGLTVVPFAVALFIPGVFRWWLVPIYWGVNLIFFGRFILMLHNTSHRRLFKRRYRWMNATIPWCLGPFFGETPDTYFVHHVGMHHVENNLPDDLSSTMRFRRDSVVDFTRYFTRFFTSGLIELGRYQWRKGRRKLLQRMLAGELAFYALIALLLLVDWRATLVVFILPLIFCRFMMMAGNWAQHAFIDPSDPGNSYRNSITCINCGYNRACFNDGYHISHHVKQNRHWTEHPAELAEHHEEYARQGAILFEGVDFFMIWALLMLKRYDWLARRFVDLSPQPRSRDEVVALLRARTRPITG